VSETTAPAPAADAPVGPVPRRRRIDRETWLMITVPPLLVLLIFGGYVL
jgi:hypothetical protein